jgi:hypothetical protein
MSTEVPAIPVAPENPWPGLAPYTEQQSQLFFGREEETEELLRLIQRETLTVLFGRSGSGKSSLLHAGVIPRLRSGMYFPVMLRLNFADPDVDPVGQVRAIALAAAQKSGLDIDSRIKESLAPTLWEFFHNTDFWGPRNDRLTPLLIFDQFEEAFTIGKDQRQSLDFLEQLADLAENRVPLVVEQRIKQSAERVTIDAGSPTYKIVLSLREDFVSRLDQLRPILPAIMRNRMGLLPLDGTRALQVIVNSGKPWVSEAVAQDIVAALAGEARTTGSAIAQAEIEPAYLSVMCHELFRRMVELGLGNITSELVAKERGEILEAMYDRSFEGLAAPVRLFVEDRLLTASGFRGTLPLSEALAEGVSLHDLETLVDRRLLRFEDRLGTRHVELSHDLLTGVVKKSRELRAARAAREEEERKQQELRHALIRARKRTAIAAAIAVLALAGVAYSAYYWLAYIHPTQSYYMAFTEQLGKFVPFGELKREAVRHRSQTFKVTRQGFRGEILNMEVVDSRGNPTMQNSLSTALTSDQPSNQGPGSRYCRVEFQYDEDGRMVYETAWNQNHRLIWGVMYVHLQGQGDSLQARNATYFGPDGLPTAERPGSMAEIIHIEDHGHGHIVRKYLSWDAKPVPGPDKAYGQEIVYDEQGRVISFTSLDADGHPMNDASGNATYSAEYDKQGNDVLGKATDALGRPTLFNKEGYSTRKLRHDAWGNETEEAYFDVDGSSPMIDQEDGAHIVREEYDDHGNVTRITYFDIYGKPIDRSGIARYHRDDREYNQANQLVRETFFDSNGHPTKGDVDAYDIRLSYDSHGNISEVSFFDGEGKAANGDSGIHLMRRTYDDRGQILEESYFGPDSKPANTTGGYQSIKLHYDDNGRRDTWSYYDSGGNPQSGQTYWQLQVSYDRWGNITERRYIKTSNSSFPYDIERTTHDEFGNPLKTCYFAADGAAAATPGGVSCTVSEYDGRGLEIRETNLDKSGKLKADSDGIARIEYAYNDKQLETKEEYFGVIGPVNGPNSKPHDTETEYDAAGHKTRVTKVDVSGNATIDQYDLNGVLTEESYRDAQGRLRVKQGNTYALVRYERTEQGRKVVTRYFGTDEKPVLAKDGCATERKDLDAKGKLLKDACFDVNESPMESKSNWGAAVLTFAYDANGNITKIAAFGPDGKPVQTTKGYARLQNQYDAAGKRIRAQAWMPSGESTVSQFDAEGNQTEGSYYDAQGKLMAKTGETFAIIRYEWTDQGRKVVARYFGPDEKPVLSKEGCAVIRAEMDAEGNPLKAACFDLNDRPVATRAR